jgi:hypothetical protein
MGSYFLDAVNANKYVSRSSAMGYNEFAQRTTIDMNHKL